MLLFLQSIQQTLSQPWPWYISGALIASTMILILFMGKHFGVSASMRATCSALGAGKFSEFFNFDWKGAQAWNLVFVLGALIGGFIASTFLSNPEPIQIGERTAAHIADLGLSQPGPNALLPQEFSEMAYVFSLKGIFLFIIGGFMVGFGSRYAGGCTSGHAISGLSELQPASLIAVVGFFLGGLIMTHFLLPLLFAA